MGMAIGNRGWKLHRETRRGALFNAVTSAWVAQWGLACPGTLLLKLCRAWGCGSGARFSLTGTKLELKAAETTLPMAKHPLGTFSTKQSCSIFIPWSWKVCRPSCLGDALAANSQGLGRNNSKAWISFCSSAVLEGSTNTSPPEQTEILELAFEGWELKDTSQSLQGNSYCWQSYEHRTARNAPLVWGLLCRLLQSFSSYCFHVIVQKYHLSWEPQKPKPKARWYTKPC